MRKAVIPFVLSVGLMAVWAVPADAASTRSEYIAQVDPICATFVGPENGSLTAFLDNAKRLGRVAKSSLKSGNFKPFIRQTRRTAGSLNRYGQIHASLTDQIVAVPPAPGDEGTISTWINARRQAEGFVRSAASALNQFKFRLFAKRARQSDAAEFAGTNATSGMGFQVCGVSV
jgi:hypothetical protein